MTASSILMLTILTVLLVMALALLAGSIALMVTAGAEQPGQSRRPGLEQALHQLDRQWRLERLIYHHHRIFGLIVILVATICIWQLLGFDLLQWSWPRTGWQATGWLLLAGQLGNLVLGGVIVTRPSLLKPLETVGNRWHRLQESRAAERLPPRLKALLLLVTALVVAGTAALLLLKTLGIAAH